METVCQVEFGLMNRVEARRAEQVLREYLLRTADAVSMLRQDKTWTSLFTFLPHPLRWKKFLSQFSEADISGIDEHQMTFALTEHIKNLLNQSTLFMTGAGRFFYKLTDPKFYKNGKEIADMIVSDSILMLHIPDSDKAWLADQGVYMDSPQI